MRCKYCNTEMDEDRRYCPECGKRQDGENKVKQNSLAKKPKTPLWQIIAAGVLIAALAGLLVYIFIKDSDKTVTDRNSGGNPAATIAPVTPPTTVTDPTAENKPTEEPVSEFTETTNINVGTLLGKELSNGLLQLYYSSIINDFVGEYGSELTYFGLDITAPLADQAYPYEGAETWEEFFLSMAQERWETCIAMLYLAEKDGFTLGEEETAFIEEQMAALDGIAKENNYVSATAMIKTFYGDACTLDIYREYLVLEATTDAYYYSKIQVTDQQIEEGFVTHEATLKEDGITKTSALVSSVRHILIEPEGGTTSEDGSTTTYSDEEWAACLAEAEKVLAEWKAGEATEESFVAMVEKYTDDSGSKTTGGLYENVANDGSYVEEFQNWAIDTSRKTGDVELVRTQFGYHLMYYVSGEPEWIYYTRILIQKDIVDAMKEEMAALLEENPAQIQKDAMALQNIYAREM